MEGAEHGRTEMTAGCDSKARSQARKGKMTKSLALVLYQALLGRAKQSFHAELICSEKKACSRIIDIVDFEYCLV
ncbi:hypothetical protein DCAR_0728263 [Daucus carota subsp. sativus]|uniref:Uncharacterized protein n=1 Tax=Daucus carota subsp. sativus TaxID=79200 RepID=A0A161X464_DAUCS|nr:hypothetical protein DCAR_0728263 [Daucus carota subsp. sativus]